jgi:hypothetical protein
VSFSTQQIATMATVDITDATACNLFTADRVFVPCDSATYLVTRLMLRSKGTVRVTLNDVGVAIAAR